MLAVMQPDAEAAASPNPKVPGEFFSVTNDVREVSENGLKYDWLCSKSEFLEAHDIIVGEIENHRFQ
jgi:hypothetical protein